MTKGPFGRITGSDFVRIPPPGSPLFRVWRLVEGLNTRLYRASGGRIGGSFDRAPVLILHHVGRRSGEARQTPLLYLEDGDDLVVVGSMGGSDANPAWFYNLRARPDVEVEIRGERRPVRARAAMPEERERLWPALLELWPAWEDYTRRTDREFPILVLEPRPGR